MPEPKSILPQPDKKTIIQCKNGDTNAFGVIVEMYQDYVRNLIFKIITDNEQTNDLAQETFIKVWLNIKKYNNKYLFSTWLYQIATNNCLDYLKTNKNRASQNIDSSVIDPSSYDDSDYLNKDLIKTIRLISRQLPMKQRMVFILKDLQDLSIEEVSGILKINKGSVKSNLYYARKLIKGKILKMEKQEDRK